MKKGEQGVNQLTLSYIIIIIIIIILIIKIAYTLACTFTMYLTYFKCSICIGLTDGSVVKNPPAKQEMWVRFLVLKIPWRRDSLQYSCLENPMDRGAWQATVHGVAKSQT